MGFFLAITGYYLLIVWVGLPGTRLKAIPLAVLTALLVLYYSSLERPHELEEFYRDIPVLITPVAIAVLLYLGCRLEGLRLVRLPPDKLGTARMQFATADWIRLAVYIAVPLGAWHVSEQLLKEDSFNRGNIETIRFITAMLLIPSLIALWITLRNGTLQFQILTGIGMLAVFAAMLRFAGLLDSKGLEIVIIALFFLPCICVLLPLLALFRAKGFRLVRLEKSSEVNLLLTAANEKARAE